MSVICIFCGRLIEVPIIKSITGNGLSYRPDLKKIPLGVGYAQSRISRHYNFFHNECFNKEVTNNVRKSDR